MIDRRAFLQGTAAFAAIACGGGADDAPGPSVTVAATRHSDVRTAIENAITLAGGLADVRPGDRVFVKPNAVYAAPASFPGVITAPPFVAALVSVLKDLGAKVIVGDRSARGIGLTETVFEATGLRAQALAAGADEVFPAPSPIDVPDAWVLVKPPHYEESWGTDGGILAMRKIVEADHLVIAPTCKNHRWAGVSLTMKNLIGAIGDGSRNPMHYVTGDPEPLGRDIAILNQAFPMVMSLLDARLALVNGGPEGVGPDRLLATPDLVLASRDRLALDAFGTSIIRRELARATVTKPDQIHAYLTSHRPWDMPQVRQGAALGLGVSGADRVELAYDGVPDDDRQAIEAYFRA